MSTHWPNQLLWAVVSAGVGAAVAAAMTILVFGPAEEARDIAARNQLNLQDLVEAGRTDTRSVALSELDALTSVLLLAEDDAVCDVLVLVSVSSGGELSAAEIADNRRDRFVGDARQLRNAAWAEIVEHADFEKARSLIDNARSKLNDACAGEGPSAGGIDDRYADTRDRAGDFDASRAANAQAADIKSVRTSVTHDHLIFEIRFGADFDVLTSAYVVWLDAFEERGRECGVGRFGLSDRRGPMDEGLLGVESLVQGGPTAVLAEGDALVFGITEDTCSTILGFHRAEQTVLDDGYRLRVDLADLSEPSTFDVTTAAYKVVGALWDGEDFIDRIDLMPDEGQLPARFPAQVLDS